jgi:hypothetical protein
MRLATKPAHYFGKVKITPLNGKAYYVSFCLRVDSDFGPMIEEALK